MANNPSARAPAPALLTVSLTTAQLAALARAVFTDTSARPAAEKNAAESAVRQLQAEARRRVEG